MYVIKSCTNYLKFVPRFVSNWMIFETKMQLKEDYK